MDTGIGVAGQNYYNIYEAETESKLKQVGLSIIIKKD